MHIQSFHRLAQPSCPTIVAYISFYACAVSAGFPSPTDDCAPCNALFALRAKALLTWSENGQRTGTLPCDESQRGQ